LLQQRFIAIENKEIKLRSLPNYCNKPSSGYN
jgi:hypothetical protein